MTGDDPKPTDESTDEVQTVDPQNPPTDETVLLMTGINGLFHTPEVVEGTTSSTGKTIHVPEDEGTSDRTRRLDSETIFAGGHETRGARYFELYTPERLRKKQRINKQPGPRAGTNSVSEPEDLPEPTHYPDESDGGVVDPAANGGGE